MVREAVMRVDIEKKLRPAPEGSTIACTCPNTKCIRMYCVCYTEGYLCNDRCRCDDCHNNLEHKDILIEATI
jgi:hypothetical protein